MNFSYEIVVLGDPSRLSKGNSHRHRPLPLGFHGSWIEGFYASDALSVLEYHPRDRFAGHSLLLGFVVTGDRGYSTQEHNMQHVTVFMIILYYLLLVCGTNIIFYRYQLGLLALLDLMVSYYSPQATLDRQVCSLSWLVCLALSALFTRLFKTELCQISDSSLNRVIHVAPPSALVTKYCLLFMPPALLAPLVCVLSHNTVLSYIYGCEEFEISI